MATLWGSTLLMTALCTPAAAFLQFGGPSSHISITRAALLQKVTEACEGVAKDQGFEFQPTGQSPEELVQACVSPKASEEVSGAKFQSALQEILMQNGDIDQSFANSAPHHFHSEAFVEGRRLLTEGMVTIKENVRRENFQEARETLGRILHTLQDFYSHSNWVELGFRESYINLLHADLPLNDIADVDTPTCRDCSGRSCPNPILTNILREKKLTSGYMGTTSSSKPQGKCSHGGPGDQTSTQVPRGGINKDVPQRPNDALHNTAVRLAAMATLQLLDNIRHATGNTRFLRMMGISRPSMLAFVIDTTGSMAPEIAAVISTCHDIINTKKGTPDEPSEYILVPFNDPDFGPVMRSSDPDQMKAEISKLTAVGGGDPPEMCLSGLQMALTDSSPSSTIFVFTDTTAKDISLMNTIKALIHRTKSTVNFMISKKKKRRRRSVAEASFEDYEDLALLSGGHAISVSKAELPKAMNIIVDSTTSSLVTVMQRTRDPGKRETFPFVLDESLKNVIIYITGGSLSFSVTDPEGVSQSSSEGRGPLGSVQSVGNLFRIQINSNKKVGQWEVTISSTQPYTVKVTGQSVITFIYDFVQNFEGSHPGYTVLSGRPRAGEPASLMLTVMGRRGPSSVDVDSAGLVLVSSPGQVTNSSLRFLGNGAFLLTVQFVPEGSFVVFVTGTDKVSNTSFLRQSNTQMSISKVNVKAAVGSSAHPGRPLSLPFSVVTQSSGGSYTISIRNDKNFSMTYPNTLMLTTGELAHANLTITPPADTPSGTAVTVTIDAARDGDSNYAVLRLSVVAEVTDMSRPLCGAMVVHAHSCPVDVSRCHSSHWELWTNVTDGNGTGVERVLLHRGDGELSLTPDVHADSVHVSYNASCCSGGVELVVVDKVGNVGRCGHSIARSSVTNVHATLWIVLMMLVCVRL